MAFYEPDQFNPDRSVGYLSRRVYQIAQQGMAPLFEEEGLSYLQWSALVSIWYERGGTCAVLARDIGHDAGATTRLIDGLQKRGLIDRQRDQNDRRVINLQLTDSGAEAALRIKRRVVQWWNERLEGWADDDIERLIGYLLRLRGELEATCG